MLVVDGLDTKAGTPEGLKVSLSSEFGWGPFLFQFQSKKAGLTLMKGFSLERLLIFLAPMLRVTFLG